MSAHRKLHAINNTDDHSGGTASTLLGTNGGGTLTEVGYGTAATGSNIVQREADGNITLPSGETATGDEAISVNQAQTAINNAVDGLKLSPPVQVMNVISDVVTAQPGAPNSGDAYFLASTHTGASPIWSAGAEGDLVVYTGTAWALVIAGSGGLPAAGIRVVVTGFNSGTGGGSFAGHDEKIGYYSAGWTFEAPEDGTSTLVIGENDPNENARYAYDANGAAFPGGEWVRVIGATPNHNATGSIQGGNSTERYHLTLAQHTLMANHKGKITLAGAVPSISGDSLASILTADGDWAFAVGTGGESYLINRLGSSYYAVELGTVAA